jgi:hypothetical protein
MLREPFAPQRLTLVIFTMEISMALGPGSIAFVGFNADGNDGFAFIVIDPIAAGSIIRFSDNEWNGLAIGSGGAFNTG